jgi:hypothetical protein
MQTAVGSKAAALEALTEWRTHGGVNVCAAFLGGPCSRPASCWFVFFGEGGEATVVFPTCSAHAHESHAKGLMRRFNGVFYLWRVKRGLFGETVKALGIWSGKR